VSIFADEADRCSPRIIPDDLGYDPMDRVTRRSVMATTKQKEAARRNLKKARGTPSTSKPKKSAALSTAEKNDLPDSKFAFPKERKEPIIDAKHVRNAVARFDQVEGVSDSERDRAWRRIKAAAKKFDVEIEAKNWRELFDGGKARKH